MTARERLNHLLMRIYGPERGRRAQERLNLLIERFPQRKRRKTDLFTQNDVALITYGDSLLKEGMLPLEVLNDFVRSHLTSAVSLVHYLPFFPWSSDDGFSVKDFHTINPELGTWRDVSAMGAECELMFDFVINHFSSQSQWFKDYLAGKQGFQDMAIEVDPSTDVSMVTRPRSLPLLTPYSKKGGDEVHLWTTFSADQIDFNYESLDVLEKMIEVLLFYVEQGASVLRLDAIAYLWKQIGTPCIHLEQTHAMVQVFRAVLDLTAPDVLLITETNVPHEENVSYFGDGRNEAQMVYNFTLPPLLLHTFVSQDTRLLSEWAAGLTLDSPTTTFFNFTASHDGIGVRPLEGILPPEEIDGLVDFVQACGGFVSTKRNGDGSDSPYELNISYVDAIVGQEKSLQAERFLASQAIQYALPGVPATYIHSLLGSRNWAEGVQATGRARSINRQKLNVDEVLAALKQPESFRSRIFHPFVKMMALRRRQPAFHPNASFHILDVSPKVFAIIRQSPKQDLVALTNISGESVSMERSFLKLAGQVVDLIGDQRIDATVIELRPYQTLWLTTSE